MSKHIFFTGLSLLLIGCSSYRAKKQEALLAYPELGALVKTKGNLLYTTAEQIGIPHWDHLKVTAIQLPFNKESYLAYAKSVNRAAQINTVPYNDSLAYKPKYIRLQLLDKIGMAEILNDDKNSSVIRYLEKDATLKMVTSLDLALTEAEITLFNSAVALELQKDAYGKVVLKVIGEQKERFYYVSDLRAFNYGYSTFCWGEDRYHRRRIENIAPEGEKCPKGTFAKPSKVKSDKSYLKL